MLAVMDRLEIDPCHVSPGVAFVSTRGASNVAGLDGRLPAGATAIAWTQNDDAGDRWLGELEALCLRLGLRLGYVAPPPDYKDFNDLFRNDPRIEHYHRATLQGQIEQAVQHACTRVDTTVQDVPDEDPDTSPPDFSGASVAGGSTRHH